MIAISTEDIGRLHWLALFALLGQVVIAQEAPRCASMSIPVASVDDAPLPYLEFCRRNTGTCNLSGPSIIPWSPEIHEQLRETNSHVNRAFAFVPDQENSGLEEAWSFPETGKGDCEDFALEKRRRLVASGLPSASLTCGIAFHEAQLFPHAVLLVETTAGTFVLDNLSDEITCWDSVPYFFTRRERPDGKWTRFQQP